MVFARVVGSLALMLVAGMAAPSTAHDSAGGPPRGGRYQNVASDRQESTRFDLARSGNVRFDAAHALIVHDDTTQAGGQVPSPEKQQETLQALRHDVAAICDSLSGLLGYSLVHPVSVAIQSVADFQTYIREQMEKQYPPERQRGFTTILNLLGLLPADFDFEQSMLDLYTSQAAAYYDPDTKMFYLVMPDIAPSILGMLSAHELTHAFQDQRYNLKGLLFDPMEQGSLTSDESLAREFLIEGEATWAMTIYYTRSQGMDLPMSMLGMSLRMQNQLPFDQLLQQFGAGAGMLGGDLAQAASAAADIPRVLIEPLIRSYTGGAVFVQEAYTEGGAAELDSLFASPPVSTEQVLHPDRYFQQRDEPRSFRVPGSDPAAYLTKRLGGQVLETDTFGELMIRIYFEEQGMGDRAAALAAGWDGDLMAAVERSERPPALLWWSVWDSDAEAQEFAKGFRESLVRRFPLALPDGQALCQSGPGGCWLVECRGDVVHMAGFIDKSDETLVRRTMADISPGSGR